MRHTWIAIAVLALAGMAVAGDDKVTVRGCLMQIGEDFILTDASGKKFEIDEMNATLKKHRGHAVDITGELEGKSRDDKHEAQKIDAKRVDHVADVCNAQTLAAAPAGHMQHHGGVTGAAGATTTTTTTTTVAPATGVAAGTTTTAPATTTATTPGASAQVGGTAGAASGTATTGSQTSPPPGNITHKTEAEMGATTGTTTGTTAGAATATTTGTAQDVIPGMRPGEAKRVLTGCVARVGDHFVLTENGSGTKYRLDGEHDKLSSHVNRMVSVKGEVERLNEASSSGAQLEFDVEEVSAAQGTCTAVSPQQ